MHNLFDKIPDELFAPLNSRYKSIYSYCLVSLYWLFRKLKNDIRKSDYLELLRSKSDDLYALYEIQNKAVDEEIKKGDFDKKDNIISSFEHSDELSEDKQLQLDFQNQEEESINSRINTIIRTLSDAGWFLLVKNNATRAEKILIPAYSLKILKILTELTTDNNSYLPIVHQTYAELKMEDEKEDDYMYQALLNARSNADTIDLSVMLLRQQIQVFGTQLDSTFDPNTVLKQHFDEYRVDISEKYYHPMKTFDSLGLYAQPTINILNGWLNSERKLTRLILCCKSEPANKKRGEDDIAKEIIKTIQDIIEIFSRLQKNFDEIDKANANYTEAVQRKINYLSSSDKTIKGKIDKIILTMANEIKNNYALSYEELPIVNQARECLNIQRAGFLDGQSATLPMKRENIIDGEPLAIEDDLNSDDFFEMNNRLTEELNRFSDSAILEFIDRQVKDTSLTTEDISIDNSDNLVLVILSILKADLETIPYKVKKIKDRIEHQGYYMPLYEFTRMKKERKKNV